MKTIGDRPLKERSERSVFEDALLTLVKEHLGLTGKEQLDVCQKALDVMADEAGKREKK